MASSPDFAPSPALYPFESRYFASRTGGRVHYVDEGEGPPILFLHGNPTWSFLYRRIVARLRSRFRCVALDYPGFGLSERPDPYGYTAAEHAAVVGELADHLGLDGLVVMGQDWGGPIGLSFAASAPERIAGFVLGNTWFWPLRGLPDVVFPLSVSSPPAQLAFTRLNSFVELGIPLGTARRLSREEMDHYRKVQPSPAMRRGIAALARQTLLAGSWLEALSAAVPGALGAKPALLTWGMRDPALHPARFVPRVRAAFADSTLVELPRARHFIQEDAPDEIAEAISARFG